MVAKAAAPMRLSEAVAAIDFDVDLDDDEVISDVVLLARVTRLSDGRNSVTIARSPGADEVTVAGLLECGRQINQGEWRAADE